MFNTLQKHLTQPEDLSGHTHMGRGIVGEGGGREGGGGGGGRGGGRGERAECES